MVFIGVDYVDTPAGANEYLTKFKITFPNAPDLKSNIEETRQKANLLYKSLVKLLSLPDGVIILPAHTSKPVDFDGQMISTTISEAKKNISVLHNTEEGFINLILDKIPPSPPNYLAIVEKNLAGNFSDSDSVELEAGANRCAIS